MNGLHRTRQELKTMESRRLPNYPTGIAAVGRSIAVGTLTSLGVYLTTQNLIWALCGYLMALLWGAGEVVRYSVMVDREYRRITGRFDRGAGTRKIGGN